MRDSSDAVRRWQKEMVESKSEQSKNTIEELEEQSEYFSEK